MKSAGTSIEYAIALRYPLTNDDICTGNTNLNSLYGDWAKNMENHPKMNYGKAEHWGPQHLHSYFPFINLDLYKKYCIVRNPWDTMVSYYWYIHELHSRYSFDPECEPLPTDDFGIIKVKFNTWMKKQFITRIFKDDRPPWEFPYETVSRVNEPMVEYADKILRFENLVEDTKSVLDIEFTLPRFKSGTKRLSNHYRDYYIDQGLIDSIAKSFPNTIKLGNYNF